MSELQKDKRESIIMTEDNNYYTECIGNLVKRMRGNRRKTINIEESSGFDVKNDIIQFVNGSTATLVGGLSGAERGARSNYITLKDESGDVVVMDMRDNSYRVVWTKEELEEGLNGEL